MHARVLRSAILPPLLLGLVASIASAQVPAIDWRTGLEFVVGPGFSIHGNFVLDSTEHVYASSSGPPYKISRIDPAGRVLWTREVTGVGQTKAFDVEVDSQDNALVTGYDQGTFSYVTTKFDTAGNLLWKQVRKDGLRDEAFSVAVDAADNVYVTGHSQNATTFSVEFMTIKYDPNGNEQWLRRAPLGQGMKVEVTPSGRVAVMGDAGNAFSTVSYDTDGNELWSHVFTPALTRPYDMMITDNGSVFVCGAGGPGLTGVVVHYAASGAIEWVANHTSPSGGWDLYRAMTMDPFGNIVVAGQSFDGWTTTKFDPNGNFLWNRTGAGPGPSPVGDIAFGVGAGPDGAVYVTGGISPDICPNVPISGTDAMLRKYDADGTLVYETQLACSGGNTGTVAVDSRGGVLFAVWDEIFRLDPACAGIVGSEVTRLGSPPNPNGFLPGQSGPPTIGKIWDPIIDHNVFATTQPLVDFIAVSTQAATNVPSPFGTILLVPPPTGQVFFNTRIFRRVYVRIPAGCSFVGLPATAQAGSYSTAAGIELTNALDIVIGSQ